MTDKPTNETLPNPQRRRLIGGVALAGASAALGAGAAVAGALKAGKMDGASVTPPPATDAALDTLLDKHIQHVVVLYAENRSFNNLFAAFPGLEQPLAALKPEACQQCDRDGKLLQTLPPIWRGMVPHKQVVNHRSYQIDITGLPNAPVALHTPDGEPLSHGLITRDLIHAFYQNQLQINGGKNDHFVEWGDSGAVLTGHYSDSSVNLRPWRLAEQSTLCDNFFMGAFGGSFLNHQYLIAAQPAFYPKADQSVARARIAVTQSGEVTDHRLKLAKDSPASAMDGKARFATPNMLAPDFWAVNAMGPPYSPGFKVDPHDPALADASNPATCTAQTHKHLGDVLSAKNVDWAWYGGAWRAVLDGHGDEPLGDYPDAPNFQPHHQPFDYFVGLAPGTEA